MKSANQRIPRTPSLFCHIVALVVAFTCFTARPLLAADQPLTDKAKEAARETSAALADAGNAAADTAKDLWQRIDAARLKNRTTDELVAWVFMGVLVGAVAGMMTARKQAGSGYLGRLVLGLAGAFLGGMVVHVGRFDFGWGIVLIRYEELLFSLGGAILLLLIGKFIRSRLKKKMAEK